MTNIVNIIKGENRARKKHKKFIQFLKDLEADYEDMPLFSRICWLCHYPNIKIFLFARKEILHFFQSETKETTNEYQFQLSDDNFIDIGLSHHDE